MSFVSSRKRLGECVNAGIIAQSQIRIVCEVCTRDDVFVHVCLNTFVRSKSYLCNCKMLTKKRQTWNGELGFTPVQILCEKKNVRPMIGDEVMDLDAWNQGTYHSKSEVSFKCRKCLITKTMLLSSFGKVERKMICLCHFKYPWKSPEGYEEFKKLLDRRNCEFDLTLDVWMNTSCIV